MRFYLPLEPDNVPPKQRPQPQRLPQESACPSPLLNSFHSLLPMFLRTIKLNGWATAGRNGRWLIRFARRIAACVGIGGIRCSQAYNHGIRIGNGHVVFTSMVIFSPQNAHSDSITASVNIDGMPRASIAHME